MKNVDMTVDGNILTIEVDLSKEFGPSSSAKTIIIASTESNVSILDTADRCHPPTRANSSLYVS